MLSGLCVLQFFLRRPSVSSYQEAATYTVTGKTSQAEPGIIQCLLAVVRMLIFGLQTFPAPCLIYLTDDHFLAKLTAMVSQFGQLSLPSLQGR